jgi:hypothetical protein
MSPRGSLHRCAARCIARFFLLRRSRALCPSLHRSFLSLVDVLHAALLAKSLVLFPRPQLARRAAHCIACLFHLSTSCPPRRSLHRLFYSLVHSLPAALLTASLVTSLIDMLPAASLSASLVSFPRRQLARRAAHRIACLFHLSTSCPPRRSRHRMFIFLVDVQPTAPLAESLVSFTCRRLGRRAARCFACFYHLSTSCPPRRFLRRLFSSLADVLPAVLLTGSCAYTSQS